HARLLAVVRAIAKLGLRRWHRVGAIAVRALVGQHVDPRIGPERAQRVDGAVGVHGLEVTRAGVPEGVEHVTAAVGAGTAPRSCGPAMATSQPMPSRIAISTTAHDAATNTDTPSLCGKLALGVCAANAAQRADAASSA